MKPRLSTILLILGVSGLAIYEMKSSDMKTQTDTT